MNLKRSRRGVSEVIVTMMLLAVTAVGGVLVWSMFSGGSDFQDVGSIVGGSVTTQKVFILTGFDTRDGTKLSGIVGLDNDSTTNGQLDSGQEYIVLKIRNENSDSAEIVSIKINEITHKWDGVSSGDVVTTPPAAGEFTVISDSTSSRVPREVEKIFDVRLVIALSNSISPDIQLNEPIDVGIHVSGSMGSQFVIPSGGAR